MVGTPVRRSSSAGPSQKEGGIAPQLVDDEPPDQAAVVVGEEGEGAVKRGEHPPAVDVADHDGPEPRLLGDAQVDDVVVGEIDLGRAAGALAHDHVEALAEIVEGREHQCQQSGLGPVVAGGVEVGPGLAHDDDLAGAFPGRLQEDGVHGDLGRHPGRQRLYPLGPTDLVARGGDIGVERHVLRLERCHLHPLAGEDAAQSGHDGRLAGVATGAAHHQSGHRAASRRCRLRSDGTAMRAVPGRPKLAQSRTRTPREARRARSSGGVHQYPVGVGVLGRKAVVGQDVDQAAAQACHLLGPRGQIDRRQEIGEGLAHEAIDGPAGLAGREAGNQVGARQDIADSQPGARQELGE